MGSVTGSHETSRANPSIPETRFVLRADLEIFEAPDGNVYLLGPDEDHVVEQPGPSERELLRALGSRPLTRSEMVRRLKGQADERPGHEAIDGLLASGLLNLYRPRSAALSPTIAERYDRQLAYFALTHPGAEHDRQERLAPATVVVIGVGGLGSWSAAALACIGVGKLVLIDDDRVELSNLNRQVLFRDEDIGALKVEVAAGALRAFNPDLEIEIHPERICSPQDLERFLPAASMVVASADWPPSRIGRWINEACARARVPHISAGQIPPYIRVGPMVIPGQTGCVECDERATRQGFPFYEELAAQRERATTVAATLGPGSAMVGAMIGMEILHYLTGISTPATLGRAVSLDLRSWQTTTRELTRDTTCPVCGDL